MLKELKELSELSGVSGDEIRVREYIRRRIKKYATQISEDPYGNLIVRKGPETRPRIMLAAHMDEVGLMIAGIEKNGLLRCEGKTFPYNIGKLADGQIRGYKVLGLVNVWHI